VDETEMAEGTMGLSGIFHTMATDSGSFQFSELQKIDLTHESHSLLSIIAQKVPKSHVFQSFIRGDKVKAVLAPRFWRTTDQ
jgi:queuine/archaeosine tRNA-ribosyltransferase